MKILDLLDRTPNMSFMQAPTRAQFRATLDRIDKLWLDGELNPDEIGLLSDVSYALRHSPTYTISDSILAAIDVMRSKVYGSHLS